MKKEISLYFNTGSLPPQYAYSYSIEFETVGFASFRLSRIYPEEQIIFEDRKKYAIEKLQNILHRFDQSKPSDVEELKIGKPVREVKMYESARVKIFQVTSDLDIEIYNELTQLYEPNLELKIAEKLNY